MTETIYCAVCGNPIKICLSHVPRRTTCSKLCRGTWQRQFEIDPDELLLAVWTEPVLAIAPSFGGLGLGLSIAKQVILQHKGSLAVDSVVGHGSTFRMTLPAWRK
jgi:hypothetical protein